MHWKGLRISSSDGNDSKRRSIVEPQSNFRYSEHLPRPTLSTTHLPSRRSESASRSPPQAEPEHTDRPQSNSDPHDGSENIITKTQSPGAGLSATDGSNVRRNRFSFFRLRHASDPQLSKSYAKAEEDIPPVPSLPPPTIITTAPTSHDLDQPTKRRPKFSPIPEHKKSPAEAPSSPTPMSAHTPHDSIVSQSADPALSASASNGEEAGRLSTTSIRSSPREQHNDSYRSSVADPRFSESSRSDQSLGDRGMSRSYSPRENPLDSLAGGKRFRLPRWKRNRGPLFPLPPRPTGPPSDGAVPKSAVMDYASKRGLPESPDGDHISPLHSPARSSAGLASSRPPLLRQDSANSNNSARSTPSTRSRKTKTRARSSTLDSLANVREHEHQSSPHLTSSGRTSTSTSGRKSFGEFLGISQRFAPSPTTRSPGTPKSSMPSYPEREEGDTPGTYLARLEEQLPRNTIANILSQFNDEFFTTALRKFMRGFSFFQDPIDMAIRKLLMEVELPKETQQIDRFLQSFADRYHECNPGIFASPDQAYFIAFSILILHTDVFNKNNKRKMQKPDYVKNTRGEGIADEILECFYENISYTPFIRIEDANTNGRQLTRPRRGLLKTASSDHLSRASREPVDPYTLIMDGKLDHLRPSLKDVMNLDDTYSCEGTAGPANVDDLHRVFAKSGILQILSPRSRPDAFMPASIDNPADSNPGLVDIKVAKVGLLWRKDPKKKRARSPWQEWGALLTLSQLYFFRDVNWVKSLMAQHEQHQDEGRRRAVVFRPPLTEFKPDSIMSTDDAVALLDTGYKKHKHAFVLVRHNALEEVFLANSEGDMNDWLAKVNYAATFRTTGVRTKAMIATNYDAQRNRMSRPSSAVSGSTHRSMDKEPPSPNPGADMPQDMALARRELMQQKIREANEQLFVGQRQLDDLLRNARHLQVLTPVNSRARENVIMAAGRMAAKLKWVRQDIWRTKCYREVLVRDLGKDPVEAQSAGELPHLQIPIAHPSSAGSDGSQVEKPASPVVETRPAADAPPAQDLVSQPAALEPRRPSIPTSITSDLGLHVGRRLSVETPKERANSTSPPRPYGLERDASVASRMDAASLGSRTSKITGSVDDGEERLLRDAGLLDVNSPPPVRRQSLVRSDGDSKPEDGPDGAQGEQAGRIRRSLHRTLRDTPGGHHGHYIRSKKSRESATSSMATAEEGPGTSEGEGLSRKSASFTVHGKKASVVTFGSEWQNIPPEERLKLRKPTPSDEPRISEQLVSSRAGSIVSEGNQSDYPQSQRTAMAAESIDAVGRLYPEDTKAENDDAIGHDCRVSEIHGDHVTGDAKSQQMPPRSPKQAINV
ncbi:Arf family guanine nucleotide exchange factor SYT1 [Aspergillus candidus]|uniref:Guanyl-nucleotide exchange factor n=1 Tax=Aspergillus candidus TaxID=41067 RepID=A0A2I2FFV2_ASPCN|nr:hypothetical protein BDW47DRAFT_130907 [Aspergillus candidus]PLB39503.1 hypothetical protein BDW47DRAFT_130907 [Aspergillus candidus]